LDLVTLDSAEGVREKLLSLEGMDLAWA